ncbi:hypothetical protein MMC30_007896 [Trapelia coarctata]|nr:hypothetical protein [Trapelia coarctata]
MSSNLTDPPQSLILSTPSISEISFNFFLSDPSLGAIFKPGSACGTAEKFFDAAITAWSLTSSKDGTTIATVKVSWKGAKRSLVIPRQDPEGFRRMMSSIQFAAASENGEIEVDVTCIPQQ